MKLLNTILCVFFLVIPMEYQKKPSHAAPGSECTLDAHAHQFNDLRFAAIEVVKIGKCGFSFVDLEDHTVGLDNYFQFADDFVVVNVKKDQGSSSSLEMLERSKQAVKENVRCLAMYCYVCKVAFSLKPMQGDHPSLR
jgi:hypothetical protein